MGSSWTIPIQSTASHSIVCQMNRKITLDGVPPLPVVLTGVVSSHGRNVGELRETDVQYRNWMFFCCWVFVESGDGWGAQPKFVFFTRRFFFLPQITSPKKRTWKKSKRISHPRPCVQHFFGGSFFFGGWIHAIQDSIFAFFWGTKSQDV